MVPGGRDDHGSHRTPPRTPCRPTSWPPATEPGPSGPDRSRALRRGDAEAPHEVQELVPAAQPEAAPRQRAAALVLVERALHDRRVERPRIDVAELCSEREHAFLMARRSLFLMVPVSRSRRLPENQGTGNGSPYESRAWLDRSESASSSPVRSANFVDLLQLLATTATDPCSELGLSVASLGTNSSGALLAVEAEPSVGYLGAQRRPRQRRVLVHDVAVGAWLAKCGVSATAPSARAIEMNVRRTSCWRRAGDRCAPGPRGTAQARVGVAVRPAPRGARSGPTVAACGWALGLAPFTLRFFVR